MPASRTKSNKRADPGNQLVWASVESTTTFDSSNSSPAAFSDSLPPLVEYTPSEFVMFPSPSDEQTAPRRQPHSKKKPENHIPRPPNAFILFRSSFIKSQHVSTSVETNHSTLSKIIGLTWSNMPEEERQIWHLKAKEALEEHKRKFPKYAFRPVQTKAKGATTEKRRVREVEPKDIKRCAKIAQLLVEGKKGDELHAAVQEFDKTHVPEIITRFEAPITARAYRRSSSVPIPEDSQPFLQEARSPKSKKIRSSSTLPTRCPTPHAPAEHVARAQSSILTVDTSLPLKQESAFNFGDFSFGEIADPLNVFDCAPISPFDQVEPFADGHFSPGLSINTSFDNNWPSSPCTPPPQTPEYIMSPTCDSTPVTPYISSYDAGFDTFFDAQYPTYNSTQCLPQQQTMMGGGGAVNVPFGYNAQYENNSPLSHLDLDFTAFMDTPPHYT